MRATRIARVPARCAAWLLACLAAGLAGAASDPAYPPSPAPSVPAPAELERLGAVIGKITVVPENIFDPSIKGESGWLYRTANKLHIKTRPQVIRAQLLFASGDLYDHRLVQETERNLRTNAYLYDARIRAIAFDGHTVDLEVRTFDIWTLNPGINFGRAGGTNEFNVHVEEQNLLGLGRKVQVAWDSNVYRDTWTFAYYDPHFLHAFNRFAVTYSDATDGSTKYVRLERPFYALDTRWSAGTVLNDSTFVNDRYELGHRVGEFSQHDQLYQIWRGWSPGLRNGWVRRWTLGATYQEDTFEPVEGQPLAGPLPVDRKFVYPWLAFELQQDAFQERVNQDQIIRTEDVLVGFDGWVRLGYAAQGMGSLTNAVLLSSFAQDGVDLTPRQSLFGSAWASGRYEHGEIRNGILGGEARYYWATSSKSKFFADISGTVTEQLDHDQQLSLGGDNGLRGYPLRYQAGTARALLTLEQRYYTDWYPFRLFRVGGAAFFDMGRTWGTDVTGETSLGLLKDVGIGLRLGSSRSAFGNVVHIDLAFPLDGDSSIDKVQLLIETKGSF